MFDLLIQNFRRCKELRAFGNWFAKINGSTVHELTTQERIVQMNYSDELVK